MDNTISAYDIDSAYYEKWGGVDECKYQLRHTVIDGKRYEYYDEIGADNITFRVIDGIRCLFFEREGKKYMNWVGRWTLGSIMPWRETRVIYPNHACAALDDNCHLHALRDKQWTETGDGERLPVGFVNEDCAVLFGDSIIELLNDLNDQSKYIQTEADEKIGWGWIGCCDATYSTLKCALKWDAWEKHRTMYRGCVCDRECHILIDKPEQLIDDISRVAQIARKYELILTITMP